MKSLYLTKNRFIYTSDFKDIIKSDPITLVDAGARGGLENPWLRIDSKILKVVGFDPDKEECDRLNSIYNDVYTFYPVALWSSEKKIKVNATKSPSCSSVYKPNLNFISKYERKHWESRTVKKILEFQASTLDKIFFKEKISCDFLKIDTQGAEYEILKGADKLLQKDIFGVLLETWTAEVYKKQYLTGDILKLMRSKGFSLFDINVAAAWQRKTKFGRSLNGKNQIIGLDLLFFKEPSGYRNLFLSFSKLIKAVAIAEVFGFPDYAIEIIEENMNKFSDHKDTLLRIKETIYNNSQTKNRYIKLIKKLLYFMVGIKLEEYPSLHY